MGSRLHAERTLQSGYIVSACEEGDLEGAMRLLQTALADDRGSGPVYPDNAALSALIVAHSAQLTATAAAAVAASASAATAADDRRVACVKAFKKTFKLLQYAVALSDELERVVVLPSSDAIVAFLEACSHMVEVPAPAPESEAVGLFDRGALRHIEAALTELHERGLTAIKASKPLKAAFKALAAAVARGPAATPVDDAAPSLPLPSSAALSEGDGNGAPPSSSLPPPPPPPHFVKEKEDMATTVPTAPAPALSTLPPPSLQRSASYGSILRNETVSSQSVALVAYKGTSGVPGGYSSSDSGSEDFDSENEWSD